MGTGASLRRLTSGGRALVPPQRSPSPQAQATPAGPHSQPGAQAASRPAKTPSQQVLLKYLHVATCTYRYSCSYPVARVLDSINS